MATKQFVVFTLDGEEFGIEITQVNIIEKPMEVFKVPNTPDFVEGVINLRGKVHTLLNLRKRFNIPFKEYDDDTRFIIAGIGSSLVGLVVDEVKEIIALDEENIEAVPQTLSGLRKEFIKGLAKTDNRVIMLPDLDSVIELG
ncbi:MAG: chemotaxis protein CheW [Acetivibrionales bacterium]|jgi:purine-binding chemotaxis protein CheW